MLGGDIMKVNNFCGIVITPSELMPLSKFQKITRKINKIGDVQLNNKVALLQRNLLGININYRSKVAKD
jgi:hypothetical protein